jgi:hypothetical protein
MTVRAVHAVSVKVAHRRHADHLRDLQDTEQTWGYYPEIMVMGPNDIRVIMFGYRDAKRARKIVEDLIAEEERAAQA